MSLWSLSDAFFDCSNSSFCYLSHGRLPFLGLKYFVIVDPFAYSKCIHVNDCASNPVQSLRNPCIV